MWRPFSLDQLAAVVSIEQAACAHPWTPAHFVGAYESGNPFTLLYEDPILIGYSVSMQSADIWHLLNLVIAPSFQKQGWGRQLLNECIANAKKHAAQAVWLEVRKSNLRAQRLYTSAGFEINGERKNYYPAQADICEDAVLMSLSL